MLTRSPNPNSVLDAGAQKSNEDHAAAHAIGLLNQFETVMTGWCLAFDREEISNFLDPLYEALDF